MPVWSRARSACRLRLRRYALRPNAGRTLSHAFCVLRRATTMTLAAGHIALLRREIADPGTQWSLGTFGAIAEFSRDEDEPAQVSMASDSVSAVTGRGGIALRLDPAIRPFASESINKADWNQRI